MESDCHEDLSDPQLSQRTSGIDDVDDMAKDKCVQHKGLPKPPPV